MGAHKSLSKAIFLAQRFAAVRFGKYFGDKAFRRALKTLSEVSPEEGRCIADRVEYYCKISSKFNLPADTLQTATGQVKQSRSQRLDFNNVFRFFDSSFRVRLITGDNRKNPSIPSLCKSRPIGEDNTHSILLKLNEFRHYYWRSDPFEMSNKRPAAVWRGACYQPLRKQFIEAAAGRPLIDAGDVRTESKNTRYYRKPLSLREQMRYRYIISLEGNDVATNLKWIMRSNSVCLMPRPSYETWFMEGMLEAGRHYVEIRDDFADIEEQIDYYESHPRESAEIVRSANEHARVFYRGDLELAVQFLVLLRYFILSGQITEDLNRPQGAEQMLNRLPIRLRKAAGFGWLNGS